MKYTNTVRILLATTYVSFVAPLSAHAESPEILYLFDASGSMNEMNGGKRRIDAAKEALLESLAKLPSGTPAGFRLFAHRIEKTNKAASCKDTELVAPVSTGMSDLIRAAVTTLSPKGYTPLAYSLSLAGSDFANAQSERQKSIILLSDGEETCDGDPIAELKALKAKNISVKVYAIGFDVDEKSRQQLMSIAKESGGAYFDAKNQEELRKALDDAAQKSLIIDKAAPTVYGQELRGGDSFETTFMIPPELFGKELRLNHHQRKNQYDFFGLNLTAGQEIQVTLKTLEGGVTIMNNGEVRLSSLAIGALSLHTPNRDQISYLYVPYDYRSGVLRYVVPNNGTYYLRVGYETYDLSKDGFTFQIDLLDIGDLGGKSDAGATTETALPITPGDYEKNFISGGDSADKFVFTATAGESYTVKIIPAENSRIYLKAKITDSLRQELASDSNAPGEGFKLANVKIIESGKHVLVVEDPGYDTTSGHTGYSLSFIKDTAPTE